MGWSQSTQNCASVHFQVTFFLSLPPLLLKLPNFKENSCSRVRNLQRQVFYLSLFCFVLFCFSFVFFSAPTRHQESLKSLPRQMSKNPGLEERETVCCLQSRVPNHMSTKRRTEPMYQTFRGENSYCLVLNLVLGSKVLNKLGSSALKRESYVNERNCKQWRL